MTYMWTNDIEDADEVLSLDESLEIRYAIAAQALIKQGWDENDPGFDDACSEESDYCAVWRIRTSSALYSLLEQWYAQQGRDMRQCIREYYEDYYGEYIYFVTGTGYDIFSSDLLGGSSDGLAREQFNAFVHSKGL